MQQSVHTVSVTPTVDTAAFATGDIIGTKMAFNVMPFKDRGGCILDQVMIADLAKQALAIDLVLFGTDPAATTFTENAAGDVDDADLSKVIGVVSLTTHVALNDNGLTYARGIGLPIRIAPDHNGMIYGVLVARGSLDYVAATDVTVTLAFRAA
jgi:hypothetical protein